MASKHTFGLANVELGPIESDGGMSTDLTPVGETVSGTATMTTEDNTVTDFNIEESDSPVESIVTAPGKITFAWSTYNVAAENLPQYLGGVYTALTRRWDAPDKFPDIETSAKITDRKGNVILVPRGKLASKINFSFAKDKLGQIDFVLTVLQPTKDGEPRLSKVDAA